VGRAEGAGLGQPGEGKAAEVENLPAVLGNVVMGCQEDGVKFFAEVRFERVRVSSYSEGNSTWV